MPKNKSENKKVDKKTKEAEKLNAVISYDGEGELLSDISSSEPLEKKKTKKTTKKKERKVVKKKEKLVEKVVKIKEKDIYNDILLSGDYFYMIYRGIIIYDSLKDKNKILIFKNNGFMIEQDDFTYSGLSIKNK